MAEKKIKRGKAFFSISAVSEMLSAHQQTIRFYEKEGLINPKRSEGNTRMFSKEDVEKLEKIIHLTHQLGINLAGVEMIFKLQKKIDKMQHDMNKIFSKTTQELSAETAGKKHVIKKISNQLSNKKNEETKLKKKDSNDSEKTSFIDCDIDYED